MPVELRIPKLRRGSYFPGLRGVKLVISDAHEGLKAAITKVLSATWQRCRVHFMCNALAYAGKSQRRIVSAWIGTAFAQDNAAAARKQWRDVADQIDRPGMVAIRGDHVPPATLRLQAVLAHEAGFHDAEVFYVGMAWRGWVAYA